MKRLIKKSIVVTNPMEENKNRVIKNKDEVLEENLSDEINDDRFTQEMNENDADLIPLDQLSEADVRHDRCPVCKNESLKREKGFKTCLRCDTIYKVLDGVGYMINK